MTKLVKTQTKGMVTIPRIFREQLRIEANSILEAKLVDNGVLFVKVEYTSQPEETELYNDKQIKAWMKLDKLDAQTATKVKRLLKK